MSRAITGKLRLNARSRSRSEPVIQAAIDSVRPAAEAKGIALEVELDPDAGLISGDADRLQQVVWNLLSNAIKFTPQGGRVEIRLARDGEHLRLCVSDDGRGIDPALLPRLFERFWQADSSTTRAQGGLGLGLAVVRHLVELHGGTVRAESEGEGRGATFTVTLPLVSELRRPGRRWKPSAERPAGFEGSGCWWSTTTRTPARSSGRSSSARRGGSHVPVREPGPRRHGQLASRHPGVRHRDARARTATRSSGRSAPAGRKKADAFRPWR